jgi:proteic killer suppression protein
VIRTFANRSTEEFWRTGSSKGWPPANLRRIAMRKLQLLDSATTIGDLRVPPGNRLEKLEGDRMGQHSIRINDQYRLCLIWENGDALQVEIVDYQ